MAFVMVSQTTRTPGIINPPMTIFPTIPLSLPICHQAQPITMQPILKLTTYIIMVTFCHLLQLHQL